MSEPDSRVVTSPTTGAKLCLLLAAVVLVWAVYWLLAPITINTANGRLFDCGNALSGPKSSFAQGLCGAAPDAMRAKAIAAGVAAFCLAVGGLSLFGFSRRNQVREGDSEVDTEVDSNSEG